MKPIRSLDNDNDREYDRAVAEQDFDEIQATEAQQTHVVKVWKQATLKNKYYEGEGMALVTQISFADKHEAIKYFHSVSKHLKDYDELYKIKSQPGPGWVQHRVTLCTE